MDNTNWVFLVIDVIFLVILAWIVWRLYKNQKTFTEINQQLQYIFKKLDDFVKRHAS